MALPGVVITCRRAGGDGRPRAGHRELRQHQASNGGSARRRGGDQRVMLLGTAGLPNAIGGRRGRARLRYVGGGRCALRREEDFRPSFIAAVGQEVASNEIRGPVHSAASTGASFGRRIGIGDRRPRLDRLPEGRAGEEEAVGGATARRTG